MKKLFTLIILALGNIAFAQSACDSLDITVKYAPFSDSFLQINVYNNGQTFFSYPQFTVFGSNGDTVAQETMNLFGIAQQSTHTLNVSPWAVPGDTFSGTLMFYYATIDSYAVCTWPMSFDLCPDTCYTVFPYIMNMGSAEVYGDVSWSIVNSSLQAVASGIFTLDTGDQYKTEAVCLDAGDYSLKVNNISLTPGGNRHIGLTAYLMAAPNPDTAFNNVDSVVVPFKFFEACYEPTSVKETKKTTVANIHSFENTIYINSPTPLGNIAVYSMDGRRVYANTVQSTTHNIGLTNYAAGIYIVSVVNRNGTTMRKVYIGN